MVYQTVNGSWQEMLMGKRIKPHYSWVFKNYVKSKKGKLNCKKENRKEKIKGDNKGKLRLILIIKLCTNYLNGTYFVTHLVGSFPLNAFNNHAVNLMFTNDGTLYTGFIILQWIIISSALVPGYVLHQDPIGNWATHTHFTILSIIPYIMLGSDCTSFFLLLANMRCSIPFSKLWFSIYHLFNPTPKLV